MIPTSNKYTPPRYFLNPANHVREDASRVRMAEPVLSEHDET